MRPRVLHKVAAGGRRLVARLARAIARGHRACAAAVPRLQRNTAIISTAAAAAAFAANQPAHAIAELPIALLAAFAAARDAIVEVEAQERTAAEHRARTAARVRTIVAKLAKEPALLGIVTAD